MPLLERHSPSAPKVLLIESHFDDAVPGRRFAEDTLASLQPRRLSLVCAFFTMFSMQHFLVTLWGKTAQDGCAAGAAKMMLGNLCSMV